ncbi:glycosyltransferase [Ornithinimicrobium cerasi]|uniref:glycosyltransferase n=1 Tax=Ornithinimicrobium cerasi TaxID=2248773 RepID=UPI000EFE82AE|nr:glycosyltransferase [Ornithinimicrobium cerasi]
MSRPDPSRPLRVIFLATVLTPRMGMENALLRVATALAQGHEVEILVLHDPGPLNVPGVTVTPLDAGSERASRRALRQRLRSTTRQEVLVVTGVWAGAQLLLAAPWMFHDAVAWEHSVTPHRLTTGRRFRLRAESVARCYRRCAAVVSVSPVVASTLRDRWGVESVVVPNLLDLPEQSPGARRHVRAGAGGPAARRSGPVQLLAVGEAKPVKNYDVLIRALPLLRVPWELRMVGGGSQEADLRVLAASLGVADRIRWLGHVDDPAPLMADSDLLVHPSASETFGYALLEAAEQWLPVVATDAPVMDSLVPDLVPGVLAEAGPQSLAAAIGAGLHQFAGPDTSSTFRGADQRRRRAYGARPTLAAWEEVLRG